MSKLEAIDADAIRANTFEMEWPPRSGKTARFPEIDRSAWFDHLNPNSEIPNPKSARPAQAALITELLTRI